MDEMQRCSSAFQWCSPGWGYDGVAGVSACGQGGCGAGVCMGKQVPGSLGSCAAPGWFSMGRT